MLSLRSVLGRDKTATAGLCADAHGFSLHAGVRCGTHQRKALERLCRTITRPAIANERLREDAAGNVVLHLKSPWRDGIKHLRMTPLGSCSAWQRGANENTNGLLRQYFPKGSDVSGYSQAHLNKVALQLNQRPRQTLGFDTPVNVLHALVASTG